MNENLYFAFCHLSILDKNYILKQKILFFYMCFSLHFNRNILLHFEYAVLSIQLHYIKNF